MRTAIWWIRRDLRLTDNQALTAATQSADQVIPFFILDPVLLAAGDPKKVGFLLQGLRELDARLRMKGSRLIVREGNPRQMLQVIQQETQAIAIFAEEDFSPYAQQRDAAIAGRLPLKLVGGVTAHSPREILKADGTPYTIFTPFSRTWKRLSPSTEILPPPNTITTLAEISGQPIPSEPVLPSTVSFIAGEPEAQRRLRAFTHGDNAPIFAYGEERNRLDLAGTSGLSPYLRFGMLSALQAVIAADNAIESAPTERARTGVVAWLNELIWREFFIAIHFHFPEVHERSFRPERRAIPWRNDKSEFAAWCAGRTGYPLVDAAMRQLFQTGWIHNRARMIVASFLIKDLLIDWRWGEQWFMEHLIDADPAANNGGWQWTAGTGTDAAPYFRVFNPIIQSKKFDPQGVYIRRWIPELANVADQFIHTPWTMSPHQQRQAGCLLGQQYPAPIVDHAWARQRALAAYAQPPKQIPIK